MDTAPRQGDDLAPSHGRMISVNGWLHVSVYDWEIRLELVVPGDVPALEDVLMALDGHAAQVTLVSVA